MMRARLALAPPRIRCANSTLPQGEGSSLNSEKRRRAHEARRQYAGSGANVAPDAPRQSWVVSMGNSRGAFTRNVQGDDVNNLRGAPPRKFSGNVRNIFRGEPKDFERAPAFEMTTAEWNETSSGAINAHMRDNGLSLKELAQEIGCSDRTAENYVSGRTAPAGLHFLRCIAVIPEFQAEVRRVSAMAGEADPMADAAAHALMRAAQKFLDARAGDNPPSESASAAGGSDSDGAQGGGSPDPAALGDLFDERAA